MQYSAITEYACFSHHRVRNIHIYIYIYIYIQYASRNPAGLLVVSCFPGSGSLVPESLGSLVPWFLGSRVPWFPGSLGPWFLGFLVPWFSGSLVPCTLPDFIS